MKPVYVINGFLESGKTEFIAYTLAQPYFRTNGRTLLVLCEEGTVEYDGAMLKQTKTVQTVLEDEAEFTPEALARLDRTYRPERIVIEYNGMWNSKDLMRKLPPSWRIEQQITIINAATFPMYFTNMKSMVADMVRGSEMIIFNRCDGMTEELASYRRNIKAINQQADIIFEDANGEINEIFEDDLPYDLNADVIALDNQGYGIWYLDSLDHLERYEGKTVEFTGMVMHPRQFPKGLFVPGRMSMTCCAEDMAFLGFACRYEGEATLKEQEWVKVRARVGREYLADYGGEGPVLTALSVSRAKEPDRPVIDFAAG